MGPRELESDELDEFTDPDTLGEILEQLKCPICLEILD
jgi:hypothetical protein